MLVHQRLPADIFAAAVQLLDARDVLRLARAVPAVSTVFPPAWEFQPQRPLREIEQLGLAAANVRLRPWPVCPTIPDGLVCLVNASSEISFYPFSIHFALHEDIRGELYADLYHNGAPTPFHCWIRVTDSPPLFACSSPISRRLLEMCILDMTQQKTQQQREAYRAKRECDPSNLYEYV